MHPPPPAPRTGRFNERLVLSLAGCASCLLLDDELNVLPTSSLIRCGAAAGFGLRKFENAASGGEGTGFLGRVWGSGILTAWGLGGSARPTPPRRGAPPTAPPPPPRPPPPPSTIRPVELDDEGRPLGDPSAGARAELAGLRESLADTQPAGSLVRAGCVCVGGGRRGGRLRPTPRAAPPWAPPRATSHTHAHTRPTPPPRRRARQVAKCRSLDQARAVVTFLDAASEKTLRSTVALTASRGRGKARRACVCVWGGVRAHARVWVWDVRVRAHMRGWRKRATLCAERAAWLTKQREREGGGAPPPPPAAR